MLHWSTCNADSQRMFLARIFRHVTLLNRFQKLPTRCSTANLAKKKSSTTGCYTRTIFRATSCHCKLALQVDQCNISKTQATHIIVLCASFPVPPPIIGSSSKPGRRREKPGRDCFRISNVFATLHILNLAQMSPVSAKVLLLHHL